ncbi:TDT family transporter [Beijerinckia mobilis]|uniref:TDT family transporter n=1 Tax=Beijerinckia mobilis TaxID=231434 RepID=UPI0005522783|nr:TDT family transporter [Beijerinckia mobilis]
MTYTQALTDPPAVTVLSAPVPGIIRNFTPNWFTVTMGTGVLALVLNQCPPGFPVLHRIAIGLWLVNIGLFGLFTLLYSARWMLYFHEAKRIFHHPVMSMFFGAVPMGLATIINGFLAFGPALIGDQAVTIAEILWWIDAALSLACGIAIPYFMFTRQEHAIEKLTAVWLLPIVACEVAAASAGLLGGVLPASRSLEVLVLGYALWACSVPLAMSILVLLYLRLAVHKLPEQSLGVSAWLALGPIGTGALGLILLGGHAPSAFAAHGLSDVGKVAYGMGILGGIIFWGYGLWWLALAVLKTIRYLREGLPFNLGWWGFTFPIGVYALATLALARTTGLTFFSVIGIGLSISLAIFWLIVAVRTLEGAWKRTLFISPCLQSA